MTMLPAMKALFEGARAQGGVPDFRVLGHVKGRLHSEEAGAFIPPGPDSVKTQDFEFPGYNGFKHSARLYQPNVEPVGLLIYIHGGGWVLNSLVEYDSICRHFSGASACAVLSIDYRLAPEHPFPTPVEDCYAAICWAAENKRRLLGKDLPIAVGGDSAGGNLSAVVSILARNRNGPNIAAQLLLYPCVDANFSRPSYTKYASNGLLTSEAMQWFWDQYVPDPKLRRDPLAAPVHAKDLTGLPPALVEVAEYDPVRDESEAYADLLAEAGVPTAMRRWYGLSHGFFQLAPAIPPAMTAVHQIGADLRILLQASAA